MEWYQKTVAQTLKELDTSSLGLKSEEVELRLIESGANRLATATRDSRLTRLLGQFSEFIILVLIGAAIIAGLLGEWVDSAAIIAIVALNAAIGFLQEEKAEKVMEALKKLAAPTAQVLRGGVFSVIEAEGTRSRRRSGYECRKSRARRFKDNRIPPD